jgi:hypothetical protein
MGSKSSIQNHQVTKEGQVAVSFVKKGTPSTLALLNKHNEPGVFPASEMLKAAPVTLRDATRLYQPVKSTSPGSRYYVVALRDDLKIAARAKASNDLSVRVEGSGLTMYSDRLTDMGFKIADDNYNKPYASIHMHPNDSHMSSRALGSLLCGLGIEFLTPLPSFAMIAGK